MMTIDLLVYVMMYLCIGVFAGLMAGILGIGGGIIVVPGLLFVFQYYQLIPDDLSMHVAAGTSLTVMIFTSLSALYAHTQLGNILWPIFNKLCPGLVFGVVCGAVVAEWVPTHWLKILFGIFLLFVSFKMLRDIHVIHSEKVPGTWLNRCVSYLIGLKSGLLGVGGGILIIPYLTYCGTTPRKIAPISNLCTLSVGLVGAFIFMITGYHEMADIPYSLGFVYWPAVILVAISSSIIAPIGAKLSYIVPLQQLKYVFIVILLLTSVKMMF
jgi:uncharacterized membrane protein YfcA